ncbi:MAG: hypothetical protein HY319_17560 [Armatimonadetes bacterium]|nr:hypothetical protein [Armatimonadota bacterium]
MRAFSLIETVICCFILSLVLLALFHLYPSAAVAIHRGGALMQADIIADSALERAKAMPFDRLAPGEKTVLDPVERVGTTYYPVLEVFEVAGYNSPWLRSLRTTVSWKEGGRQRQVVHEIWVHKIQLE